MAERNETGKKGEAVAQEFLGKKGYRILDTNWRFHHYELDIVATNGEELIVVEVKTRSENYLLTPESSVDGRKIRRIVTAADAYIRMKDIDLPVRFDIVILIKKGTDFQVENHLEDAFYAPVR
ncbi:MAG: YraN family protein [Tannerella sp.]|jgi:putative endonuclease|nr:YraN family protein [Tannerella sp.]